MQTANKFEIFNVEKIQRSKIKNAPYNPRYISDSNFDGLKKAIKKHGLHTPITINRKTGNVVVGNQRLAVLDALHSRSKNKDYELTVCVIDVPKREEAVHNVLNNNPSIQGEYDKELLMQLKDNFPDIDFKNELYFDNFDLDFIFADDSNDMTKELESTFKENYEESEHKEATPEQIQKIKETKKEYREKLTEQFKESAKGQEAEQDNYMITIVFESNTQKMDFLNAVGYSNAEKFVKASSIIPLIQRLNEYKFKRSGE